MNSDNHHRTKDERDQTLDNDLHQDDVDDEGGEVLPPEDFLCPITQQVFRDPVQDLFGHTYERAAILSWLSRNGTCPMTRKSMRASELIPNVLMKTKVRLWQREHGQAHHDKDYDKDCALGHLDDTDDSEEGCQWDRDGEEDTVLVGYWSMADTSGSDDASRFRRGRRHHARSNATSRRRTTTSGDRPIFFFMEGHGDDRQPTPIPPLDILLVEYDHIIEEEEAETRRIRRQREQRAGHSRRHRHASRSATESTNHGRQRNHSDEAQRANHSPPLSPVTESETRTMEAKHHAANSCVRNFLFARKSKNLEMVASAC